MAVGRVDFKRGDLERERGVWKLAWAENPNKDPKGKRLPTALISCPTCGKIGSLSGHKIGARDGIVDPSMVCPFGCGFHAMGVLLGWPEAIAGL